MTQIKLGFDRVPIPNITNLEPIYDILQGVPLLDANGNPLVTQIEVPIPSLANAAAATSVFTNNDEDRAVPIEEVFSVSSEVSRSLLGVPRSETQLSLFADVSTYGLNPDEFDFYTFSNILGVPGGWYKRRNETYGNHYNVRLNEEVQEQALVLEGYPVNYTFPFGPNWERRYRPEIHERYVKFVRLGNQLYNNFKDNFPNFAEDKFLDPAKVTIIAGDAEEGEVVYLVDEEEGYDLIEKWTLTWLDIRDGNLVDPRDPPNLITFPTDFGADETRPGAGSNAGGFGLLESRKAFRYQPGRISGFTFGFKCSTDAASVDNIIEWGIGNPSDQYVFQVRGAQFAIVRRSTVPLPDSVIEAQGLNPDDQRTVTSAEPLNDTQFEELVITRDFFNGDPVDSTGPSGYLLDPRKVSMYKIEFGWYGAIGAKFYAYIPASYGQARWVLLHTLVIENQMSEPCLQDPNFKFRYTLNIRDTSNLREPQFLYKYGASCYIDGGDNEAGKIYNYSSDGSLVNANSFSPLLGLYPKPTLSNRDGFEKPNKNNVYLSSLRADADQLTELQIVEVDACPAFGHHYAPSLQALQSGIVREIEEITNAGTTIRITPESERLTQNDEDAKLVTSGIFSTYLTNISSDGRQANVKRIASNYRKNAGIGIPQFVFNAETPVSSLDLSAVRFSRFESIATTDYPITGEEIQINFLNPVARDNGQYAEFLIGVTESKPSIETETTDGGSFVEKLQFQPKGSQDYFDPDLNDFLFEEFTHANIGRNRDGFETSETDYPLGNKMDLDYRIPRPRGSDSGICSSVQFRIEPRLSFQVRYVNSNPDTDFPGNFLIFDKEPSLLLINFTLINGEFGIGENSVTAEPAGITFLGEVKEYQVDAFTIGYFIEISGNPNQSQFTLWLTPISISDRHLISYGGNKSFNKRRIFSFEPKPLYVAVWMRDNARINNVTITEFYPDGTSNAFSPEWITNDKVDIIPSGGSQPGLPAENYTSEKRLESTSIDTGLRQPLRPYKVKDTVYVAPNTIKEISLENIYGPDRTVITPGLLNIKSTFFVAKSLEDNSTNTVNISVNTKEP
jgi:hypothetical protein